MAEIVRLELPEDVAYRARETARRTGRRLEAVLTEWIERGAESEETALLLPGTGHHIFTPLGNEAAAQTLLEVLRETEASHDKAEHP